MINESRTKLYCKEDISKIENYELALADDFKGWCIHHRDEVKVLPSGMKVIRSRHELIENGRYYNCPANELIFLTRAEHCKLHNKGKNLSDKTKKKLGESMRGKLKGRLLSDDTKKKMSEAKKGHLPWNKGKTTSTFGAAFIEHYGITRSDNKKLYNKEYQFYKYYGKFSWEVLNGLV